MHKWLTLFDLGNLLNRATPSRVLTLPLVSMRTPNPEKLQRRNAQAAARMRKFRARQRAQTWPDGPFWGRRLTPAQSHELEEINRVLAKEFST
jgi:hypothetical protein